MLMSPGSVPYMILARHGVGEGGAAGDDAAQLPSRRREGLLGHEIEGLLILSSVDLAIPAWPPERKRSQYERYHSSDTADERPVFSPNEARCTNRRAARADLRRPAVPSCRGRGARRQEETATTWRTPSIPRPLPPTGDLERGRNRGEVGRDTVAEEGEERRQQDGRVQQDHGIEKRLSEPVMGASPLLEVNGEAPQDVHHASAGLAQI